MKARTPRAGKFKRPAVARARQAKPFPPDRAPRKASGQLIAEFIGVTTCFITLSVLSLVVYYIGEKLVGGNRVSREVEIEGLDVAEMGVPGYSGMVMDKQSETPHAK